MKMKPILIAICNLFFMLPVFGQVTWFPTGAKWHYGYGSFIPGGIKGLLES
jgi:hypothetical protein